MRQKRQVTEECTHVIPTNTKGKIGKIKQTCFHGKKKAKQMTNTLRQ